MADTLRTDTSWRCTPVGPATTDWMDSTFDASSWILPGDYGFLADDTGGNPKPFFERTGLEPFNLWSHKARWLWTPNPIYIRKSFTRSGAGTGSVMVRGNGFSFKVYLNGALVGEKATEQDYADPLNRYDNISMLDGENVVAIEASCIDSIDFAFLKANVQWGAQDYVYSDTTWKYSYQEEGGWNDVGFDDAAWGFIGMKDQYDGTTDAVTAADWIWATDLWLRKVFVLPAALGTVAPAAHAVRDASVRATTRFYSLQGKLLGTDRRQLAGQIAVQRTVMPDGRVVAGRIGTVK